MNASNTLMIIGNLTRDAERRESHSGFTAVRFSIGCNKKQKRGDVWEKVPQYFDIEFLGNRAAGAFPYLVKGQLVSVSGELRQDQWEQDGRPRSKVYIFAHDIRLLGSKKPEAPGSGAQDFDDDIPF